MRVEIRDDGEVVFIPQNVREEHEWMQAPSDLQGLEAWLLPVPGKYGQQVICYVPPLPARRA